MRYRRLAMCVTALIALCAPLLGQEASKAVTNAADFDLPAFIKETQQTLNEPGYIALVWWIPTQYWEITAERAGMSEEKARQRYAPLRKYTLVAVVVGKIGIGNIDYIS